MAKAKLEDFPVLFRWEGTKRKGRNVVAFFPYSGANRGRIVCYAHIGQHAEADHTYLAKTKPATDADAADLLRELRGIYETGDDAVRLVVKRRLPHDWRNKAWA